MRYFEYLLILVFCINVSYSASIQEELRDLGITPLNSSPVDVSLKDMKGGDKRLSDYKGSWNLLVFWASWCNPCLSELDSLEALSRELKSVGVNLIGINLDSDINSAKKIIKRYGITYLNYWDSDGSAARAYSASSIPISYLVSPDWKLVGVIRGARDWADPRIVAGFKKLSKVKEVDLTAVKQGVGGKVDLPPDVVPPKVKMVIPEIITASKKISIEMRVEWEGDSRKYVIVPPKITLPTGVEKGHISSRSSTNHLASILTYKIQVSFEKSGEYVVGPADLSYTATSGGSMQYVRANEVTVKVGESVMQKIFWYVVSGIIFATIIIFLYGYLRLRKNNREVSKETDVSIYKSRFEAISRDALKVGPKEHSISLIALLMDVRGAVESETVKWKKELEEIRFAGKILEPYRVKSIEKELKKEIYKEDIELDLED